jgi:hypothetical protein
VGAEVTEDLNQDLEDLGEISVYRRLHAVSLHDLSLFGREPDLKVGTAIIYRLVAHDAPVKFVRRSDWR